jgi:hypothetical protein
VSPVASATLSPVRIEIIAYAPTEFFHCQHCEVVWAEIGLGQKVRARERADGLLPSDLQDEYTAVSDWVAELVRRLGRRVSVRIVDVASVEGVWKALRHGVRTCPAFVVDGRERIEGFDPIRLTAAVDARLRGEVPIR